jgi:hypothetical protein
VERSISFQRLVLIAGAAFLFLPACHAPFQVSVTDYRGRIRPTYYAGQALDLQVHWDGRRDKNKAVNCQILDTFAGTTVWKGTATIPEVQGGSLKTRTFEPPLPRNGQLGLKVGAYQWVCDLDEFTRAGTFLDIIGGR